MQYHFDYLITTTLKQTAAFLGAILLLNTPLTVQAKPEQNPSTSINKQFYEKAKRELPGNLYSLYWITERIAHVNGLDERPWRVAIIPQYQINAFAKEVHLIAIGTGILDQLAGDSSALACVVAHEMGHHVLIHQPIRSLEQADRVWFVQKKTEQIKHPSLARAISNGDEVHDRTKLATLASTHSFDTNSAFGDNALTRANFTDPIGAASRFQEYEADVAGYILAATAGFEPEGYIRAMNVLSRLLGGGQDTTSHPDASKRIEALNNLMAKYPPQDLKRQSVDWIFSNLSIPLTYQPSEDGTSLRINSRRGGSTQEDLERLLGQ